MNTFAGTLVGVKTGPIAGAPISVNVTKPDSTIDNLQTTTGTDGSYSIQQDYSAVPGDYSAQSVYAGDDTHNPGSSVGVPFTVTPVKEDVTITLTIS